MLWFSFIHLLHFVLGALLKVHAVTFFVPGAKLNQTAREDLGESSWIHIKKHHSEASIMFKDNV